MKTLHDFTDNVITTRRQELLIEKGANIERRLALIDVLLESTIDGEPLTDLDIREEVDTFVFEGHDTTTSGIAFCLYNLAKHPEVQEKVLNEIKNVIDADFDRAMTINDLKQLTYLDLVIKETLRMYPPVPMFARETQEDAIISKSYLPSCITR